MSVVWLSDRQVCKKLGNCGKTTLWRYREKGIVPRPRKLLGRNLTPEDVLDAWLEEMLGESEEELQSEPDREAAP